MGWTARSEGSNDFVLVVHGGAGVWRAELTPEREKAARADMARALEAGRTILRTNGTSLDAVETAIRIMEDSPAFNAGRGSVLNANGDVEMDAAFMDGATRKAGSVAAVRRVKNPIAVARAVMESTPHVLLVGPGADAFAKERGLTQMPKRYFITPQREEQWRTRRQKESVRKTALSHPGALIGTVGAVALDRHGNLAAGTSTGGMDHKRPGRVGDSPIVGAGTYANNATCAVSATGHGEFFIRSVVAYDVSAWMEHGKASLADAAARAIRRVEAIGGTGGLIALDRKGNVAMPFNTEGMVRGTVRAGGEPVVLIYPE